MYVFFIVPDSPNGTATVDMDLIFTLDGAPAGTYTHSVTSQQAFLYNVPVFSNSSIDSGSHTFIATLTAPSDASSVALFDYLVYTLVVLVSKHFYVVAYLFSADSILMHQFKQLHQLRALPHQI